MNDKYYLTSDELQTLVSDMRALSHQGDIVLRTNLDPNFLINVAKYYKGLPHQDQALKELWASLVNVNPDLVTKFLKTWRQQTLTLEKLTAIDPEIPVDKAKIYLDPLNKGFNHYNFDRNQIALFLAQILHESDLLKSTEEYHDGSDYEGISWLGNINPGDGKRFKGRGLIQITGRWNYQKLSDDLGIDFVSNPDLVAKSPHCVDSAFWFWNFKGLQRYKTIEETTRIINGGTNGLEHRQMLYQKIQEIL